MSDLPASVNITEEGPREGFQIEKGAIPTARKIALIDALSQTGLDHIQIVSFVNPKNVPGMADADAVVDSIAPQPGVAYTALWLNEKGFQRALTHERLTNTGTIQLCASEKFSVRNQNRTAAEQLAGQHSIVALYQAAGIPVERGSVMAAFGCNYQGDIAPAQVISTLEDGLAIAEEAGADIKAREIEFQGTPLAWAVRLCCAAKDPKQAERGRQMVEFLLKRGAATNLPEDEPWATPLAWARKFGLADIEETLLRHGAKG